MKNTHAILLLILTVFSISVQSQSQSQFNFIGVNEKQVSFRFQLINNLIVIPLTVNNKALSFILDTGVNKTILFNLTENDSIGLNNVKKTTLKGLGNGKPIEALLSKGNSMRIKNFNSKREEIYVILEDRFDISSRMGTTVHGIIGYKIFKDAVVHINYFTKRITLYNPKYYKYKKCRKCETFQLQFYRNKPYLNAKVQLDTIGEKLTDVKLLIDTGGTSALWLFEGTKEVIKTPKRFFKDILGEGLSGTIYGNKSRIKSVSLGRFLIKNPTVSFLDSTSTFNARQFKERNGSIGGNILKRFKVWIDYANKTIILKKQSSFKGGFEYNMSGIDVVYNGKTLVKEKESIQAFNVNEDNNGSKNNTISFISSYKFRFKPSYKIKSVTPNSPAYEAGLMAGDVILSINNVKVHQLTLSQLLIKFQSGNLKKIRMRVDRKGKSLKFQFRLVKKI